jgi:hypothetical protein
MTHVVGSDPPCRCLGCRRGLSVRLAVLAPAVWRGDRALRESILDIVPYGVSRRTYLPFALTVSLFSVALFLLFGGAALGLDWTVPVGTLALLLTAVAFVLQIFVVQFNRPRLLVPPSERDKPGRFGEARRRRKRRASGKPATDHEVEVLDARPPPDKPDSYTPYFVAICSDAECDWMSDPVGDERDPNPEAAVRRQAAEHSDRIAEGTRRPVG